MHDVMIELNKKIVHCGYRYIFVLLSGSLPALDSDFTSERPKWPFEEFLQGPAKSMKAEAVNFFYAKKEER